MIPTLNFKSRWPGEAARRRARSNSFWKRLGRYFRRTRSKRRQSGFRSGIGARALERGRDMSGLKQPRLGIVATALIIAISLGFVSLFSFATFTGWVAFFLLCLIPMQIVTVVTWGGNPAFAARQAQPMKGLVLMVSTFIIGTDVAGITHRTTVGGIHA